MVELAPLTPEGAPPSQRAGTGRWPRVTLACIAVLLMVQALPGLGDALLFDRDAIRQGEVWRLVTANAVHYSWAHLWGNVAVLAVAGVWAESRAPRTLAGVLGLASLGVGGAVWTFEPGILQFAGASGVAVAVAAHAAGCAWRDGGRARWVAAAVLAGLVAKLIADCAGWHWRDTAADGFVVVATSHLAGALMGALPVLALAVRHRGLARAGTPRRPIHPPSMDSRVCLSAPPGGRRGVEHPLEGPMERRFALVAGGLGDPRDRIP